LARLLQLALFPIAVAIKSIVTQNKPRPQAQDKASEDKTSEDKASVRFARLFQSNQHFPRTET